MGYGVRGMGVGRLYMCGCAPGAAVRYSRIANDGPPAITGQATPRPVVATSWTVKGMA